MLCVTYCFFRYRFEPKKGNDLVTIKCPNQAYFRLFKATIAFSEKCYLAVK